MPSARSTAPLAAPTRRTALRLALLPLAAAGLSACGFRLRGQQSFAFTSLFSGFSDTSDLGEQFVQAMAVAAPGVRVITDAAERAQAQVILDVLEDSRAKTVATYNASGEARELTLRSRLRFRLRAPDGDELIGPSTIEQTRDMSYTESAALAKEYEEETLYRDMEADLVQQLLRRLGALKSL
ncbi:MAG: LPS-assembly lipoprotein LptE [Paracidovorax wautersii]|uniref:LPS-assembly lipoprotein LptE n=1 Tax=Paracidovorax wautersii TaxID=1177982 RepID=A0A7V8JQ75_9BURK|nr:MAG: LPS-assembly lipoprotein LptE [Paracidovorax wautersii]